MSIQCIVGKITVFFGQEAPAGLRLLKILLDGRIIKVSDAIITNQEWFDKASTSNRYQRQKSHAGQNVYTKSNHQEMTNRFLNTIGLYCNYLPTKAQLGADHLPANLNGSNCHNIAHNSAVTSKILMSMRSLSLSINFFILRKMCLSKYAIIRQMDLVTITTVEAHIRKCVCRLISLNHLSNQGFPPSVSCRSPTYRIITISSCINALIKYWEKDGECIKTPVS